MTTPVCTHIRELLETMRNAVIDLFLVGVGLGVGFADTLRDDLCVTLGMTGIFTVLTLHTCRIFKEVPTECTSHNVVELL
jgi:uncharacterized transporter YbjL